jgi:cell wall-associated NlpC family hydrolase
MSNELFDVVFFGILQAGKDKETVMQNMAALFKTDASKLAPYFAGGRKVIKGKLNVATAEKYKAALENVGLNITIEPCQDSASTAAPVQPEASPEKAKDKSGERPQDKKSQDQSAVVVTPDTGDLTVAPLGTDVIENPSPVVAQKIEDINNISMAETGADVLESPVTVTAQKIDDISDISMAEVGTDVLDHPVEVVAQKIGDISDISLAEVGSDLIANPKPAKKADIPDTSELSLDD